MVVAAAAGCGRRERITIVTPPPAPVATGPAIVAAPPAQIGSVVITDTPRFREYVLAQRVPSYTYPGEVVVGAELPPAGVTFYEVPREFGMTQLRYALVNNRMVLVDPVTHRIVQIIG
jgi:hypothetical protein